MPRSSNLPRAATLYEKCKFIVTLSSGKLKGVLRMLPVFINFLYIVTLYPLNLWTFRSNPIQSLDRCSFVDNTHPGGEDTKPIKKSNSNNVLSETSLRNMSGSSESAHNSGSDFITNKIDSIRILTSQGVSFNSVYEIHDENNQKFVYKIKSKIISKYNVITTDFDNYTHSVNTVRTYLSSHSLQIVEMFESSIVRTIKWLSQYPCWLVKGQIYNSSSLNFCDKIVHFLEFYRNSSRRTVNKMYENADMAAKCSRSKKQTEFKNGIAEFNQNHKMPVTSPTSTKTQSKLLETLKSSFIRLNLHRHSFSRLCALWRECHLSRKIHTCFEIVRGNKRTSHYPGAYNPARGKCYLNMFNGLYLAEWWCRESSAVDQHNVKESLNPYHGYIYRDAPTPQKNRKYGLERSSKNKMYRSCIFGISTRYLRNVFMIAIITCVPHICNSFHHNIKYSMNVVKTKYGSLRGVVVRSNPTVEAFLGVPYASPPVGSLRYMPPVTPSTWRNTRLADRFSAVCPQVAPVAPSGPEALLEVPRGRLSQLRRLLPLLANQSEDCLYLNLYVPRTLYPTPSSSASTSGTAGFGGDAGAAGPGLGAASSDNIHNTPNDAPDDKLLPAILYIHGESYEWNSGNPYDGSVLAAHGNVIIVTINFRLGVLGFLKTGGKGSAQGNFGLMDLVAGLHWLRENLPAFGGDPNKVTVMGHGTGAALANILIVSPVASDLVHRAILLSGSALSPWAIQKDPLFVKRRVAEQTGCHGDMLVDDLAPCLRTKSISELLAVKVDTPRFLPGFAPFIDGTVIVHPSGGAAGPLTLPAGSAIASTSGIELADFPNRELIFGLTTIESYLDLSAQDLEFGFNETRRDRILRTYVRNIYHYHLNEIYAALKNEYTDWERPIRNPMGSRDASLEFLSDGHTAAPLIRLGYLHSLRGGRSYFLHFRHQSGERDFPQRGGSVRGEDVPFCLGLPISPLFPHNYTKQDIKLSRIMIRYITNFALTGNPNENPTASVDISHIVHNSKNALTSSSLSLRSSLSPHSSPPSMSLVREGFEPAEKRKHSLGVSNGTPSSPSSSLSSSSISKLTATSQMSFGASSSTLVQNQITSTMAQHQSLSSATSSVSTSVLSASATSSIIAMSSSVGTSVLPAMDHQHQPLSSSSPSLSAAHHMTDSQDARIFIAPPIHAAIKSKRHAVAAHRRKRKTGKRLPNLQHKYLAKKGTNYRKKFLNSNGDDRVHDNYGASSSSSSFLADDGLVDRRISHGTEMDEESRENEDDEDEEDTNSDEDHRDRDDDDEHDDEENNRNSLHNNNDEDNNSKNSDEENEDGNGEKFDRFGGGDFNIPSRLPFWDTYDAINQLYLEMGNKVEVKNHYRGHKLSMWLSLIPQLHSPGDLSELPMRHHHFMEDSAQYYDGIIRPQIMQRPSFPKGPVQQPSGGRASQPSGATIRTSTTANPKTDHPGFNIGIPATTECPPNTTIVPTIAATRPQNHQQKINSPGGGGSANTPGLSGEAGSASNKQENNLFRRLASSQFQSYTTALTVTIAVGCFLLLLNVLIFAGIYYQREKRATDAKKKELLREAENLCPSTTNLEKLSAGEGAFPGGGGAGGKGSRKSSLQSLTAFNTGGSFGEYSCYDEKIQCKEKHALADICSVELPLKEFKSSGSPAQSNTGSLRRQPAQSNSKSANQSSSSILMYPPSYHHPPQSTGHSHKLVHHFASPDRQGCTKSVDLVTYQQYQKPPMHQHFHQAHSHQGHQFHAHQGTSSTGSATVGTSTEQCNQSTQSEQPKVQDVATSIDEKAVGGGSDNNSERGSNGNSGGGSGSSTGGSAAKIATGGSNSVNDSDNMISPGIPEAPPPPKSSAPYQGGILRQPGPPTTPSSNKKRVQIQEISV